jgi:glycosyltransferase involved in cell wall biosynthesis
MQSENGVTVIICCYNSGARIRPTLQHIARQKLPDGMDVQLIIVDNACTDDTIDIAKETWAGLNPYIINLTIIREITPGLSNARKRGTSCARHDYIVFCDDDNWLDENYLAIVYDFFTHNPDVVIVGGFGQAVFDDQAVVPSWFDNFKQNYATGKQADSSNNMMSTVYGAGLAIQKKLMLDPRFIASPHFLDDRKATKLTAGGDSELCLKARLLGYRIGYLEDLKFKHYIPSSRLSWAYFKELHRGFAKSYIPIKLYQNALEQKDINNFSWLKDLIYFTGIYLKYWWPQYLKYRNTVGTVEEIRHITWGVIAKSYLQYNIKILRIYRQIVQMV